jgi:hypothetical protein
MRSRWFVTVFVLALFAGISSINLIGQDAVDARSMGASQRGRVPLAPQDYARERAQALRAGNRRALPGQMPSVQAAASGAATPGFGGFFAGKFTEGGNLSEATTLVTADFNHDGKPDVAAVDFGGHIEVLLNDGKGGFEAPISTFAYAGNVMITRVSSMVAEDLNGDGYPDLIMDPSSNNVLLVLINQKDGTFGPVSLVTLANPNESTIIDWRSFAVAKTTSSGYPDIVAVEPYSSTSNAYQDELLLQTFVNNGSGVFTAKPVQTIPVPASQQPFQNIQVLLNDLNLDGKMDLLLETEEAGGDEYLSVGDTVNVLLGNGDGSFQMPNANAAVNFPTPSGAVALPHSGLQMLSLTGDSSKVDLILNNISGVYVAASNGDGTFKTPAQIPNVGEVTQVLVADINGDGKPDLITSHGGALLTYLGNGDGTFRAIDSAVYVDNDLSSSLDQTAIADFNGDSKPDFANIDGLGNVQLAFGNGDGTFVATPLLISTQSPGVPSYDFSTEAAVDLNGDGIPDLVAIKSGSILSAVTNATGGFTYHTALVSSAYSVQSIAADFNGDGKQDVVLAGFDGTAAVALSNGDGTLKTPVNVIKPSQPIACDLSPAAAGDINGDGKMDLIFPYLGDNSCGGGTAVPSGYFTVLGNGDGTFMTPAFVPLGTEIDVITLAKFHGKNQPLDLIIANYGATASISLLEGDGVGNFGTPATVASGFNVYQMLTDDFNQDGKPDLTLIGSNYTSGAPALLIYPGNGDGTFGATVGVDGDAVTDSAVYSDVNGDGIPDLILDGQEGILSVNLGTGNGVFAPPIHYFFASNNGRLFAGSFLGDNTQSIVGASASINGTAFFMNQGGTSLVVTPSAVSVTPGTSVTLTAALTPTLIGQPVPTGTVTFFDGTTQLDSGAVGTQFSTTQLALGMHSITVKYSGDGHFNPNTSAAVGVTVAAPPPPPAPDFTFTSGAGSLTVAKGSSGTLNLSVAANASLSASVTFACTGLPSEATCAFAPASLNVAAGASETSVLTIGTKAASSSASLRADARHTDGRRFVPGLGAVAMAGLLCFVLPRRRGRWLVLLMVLGLGAMAGLNGCGGGGSSSAPPPPTDPGTPVGTSNVTVTATAVSGSTTVTHTMTVVLTVQ